MSVRQGEAPQKSMSSARLDSASTIAPPESVAASSTELGRIAPLACIHVDHVPGTKEVNATPPTCRSARTAAVKESSPATRVRIRRRSIALRWLRRWRIRVVNAVRAIDRRVAGRGRHLQQRDKQRVRLRASGRDSEGADDSMTDLAVA